MKTRTKTRTWVACLLLLAWVVPAAGATIIASDNAYVRTGQGDQDESQQLWVKSNGGNSNSRLAYLRFDVTGLPGDDTVAATLDLNLEVIASDADRFNVWALNDGAAETAWNSTLAYSARPDGTANLPNSNVTFLGTHTYGSTGLISVPVTAGFRNALANDTNDEVTLILSNDSGNTVGVTRFSALGNSGSLPEPSLTVTVQNAEVIPESGYGGRLMRQSGTYYYNQTLSSTQVGEGGSGNSDRYTQVLMFELPAYPTGGFVAADTSLEVTMNHDDSADSNADLWALGYVPAENIAAVGTSLNDAGTTDVDDFFLIESDTEDKDGWNIGTDNTEKVWDNLAVPGATPDGAALTAPTVANVALTDFINDLFVNHGAEEGDYLALRLTYDGAMDSYDDWSFYTGQAGVNAPVLTLTVAESADIIPEPATLALLSLAACGLGGYVRKRRRITMKATKTIALLLAVGMLLGLAGAAGATTIFVVDARNDFNSTTRNTRSGSPYNGGNGGQTFDLSTGGDSAAGLSGTLTVTGTAWFEEQRLAPPGVLGAPPVTGTAPSRQHAVFHGDYAGDMLSPDVATWTASGYVPGTVVNAYTHYTVQGNYANAAPYSITGGPTVNVNMRTAVTPDLVLSDTVKNHDFELLGQGIADPSGQVQVTLLGSSGSGGYTPVDAIALVTTSVPAGAPIPEPATMCALGLAVAGLGGYVRKRRRACACRRALRRTEMKTQRAITAVLIGLCLLAAPGSAEATILATYNFAGASPSPTTTDSEVNATAWVANDTVDDKPGYADLGFTTTDNDQAYIRAGTVTGSTQAAALADDDFFSFTISTIDTGKLLDLSTLELNMLKTGTSFSGTVYALVGGVLQDSAAVPQNPSTPTESTTNVSLDLTGVANIQSADFEIRYSDDATTAGDIIRIERAVVNGAVVTGGAIPEPATMLAVGMSVAGLGGYVRKRRKA